MNKVLKDFIEYLEKLKDNDWNVKVNSKWDVKDVIAHLVGWEEECSVVLVDSYKNNEKPWFLIQENYDSFNNQNVIKYKQFSPLKLIERWKYIARIFEEEISDIGEENLINKPEFEWVFDNSHYIEHFEQIKKAVEKSKY